ncbi:MAG: hypothetical protein IPL65_14605 [Lewinellaceae bacterium]|nr:hypothetical protein [Lewinellaceae bacterium]
MFYQTLQTEQLLRTVDANMGKFDALQKNGGLQLQNGFAIPTDVKKGTGGANQPRNPAA